jgi:hypothetical protein
MNAAKIHLSPNELAMIRDAQWLLTKNNIITKVYDLFGELAADWTKIFGEHAANMGEEIVLFTPKISRGENYNGLPYVMLDYPRCFGKEDIFAIRTLFWWGNFVSITLHLKGRYQKQFVPLVVRNKSLLEKIEFVIVNGMDEWEHDINTANSIALSSVDGSTADWLNRPFFKLAARVELSEWNEMKVILPKLYGELCKAVAG